MRIEHTLSLYGYESEYWAYHNQDFSIDVLPTVLFAKACENNNWSRSTKKVYSHIVELFFRAIRSHSSQFNNLSNNEINGFLQGYYLRQMPGQDKGPPISLERMRIVVLVIHELLKAGQELGFCMTLSRTLSFKRDESARIKLDDSDEIYTNYISQELFQKFLKNITTSRGFERARDKLALRLGYECGLRSEELVRENNFSIERLLNARVDYQLGKSIEWSIIGKGRDGGKQRYILIPPSLALSIFDFMDDFRSILQYCMVIFSRRNGRPLSSKHLTNTFSNIVNCFGEEKFNHLSAHSLRHSYATNLANYCFERNINLRLVQDRLGHSNHQTTKVYIQVAHLIQGRDIEVSGMKLLNDRSRHYWNVWG